MAYQVPQYTDFTTQFPELSNYTEAQVTLWLSTLSTPFFDLKRWDDLLFLGMLYWTAHMLVFTTNPQIDTVEGAVIMKQVGDVKKQKDPVLMKQLMDNTYYRTKYGQLYMTYQRLVTAGGMAV